MLSNEEIIARVKADRATCKVVAAAGITIDPEPDRPPNRPGLIWIPVQAVAGGPITWVESEYDPNLPGTAENPITYKPGLTAYPNYYYINNGVRKVWVGDAADNPAWEDERFAEF